MLWNLCCELDICKNLSQSLSQSCEGEAPRMKHTSWPSSNNLQWHSPDVASLLVWGSTTVDIYLTDVMWQIKSCGREWDPVKVLQGHLVLRLFWDSAQSTTKTRLESDSWLLLSFLSTINNIFSNHLAQCLLASAPQWSRPGRDSPD